MSLEQSNFDRVEVQDLQGLIDLHIAEGRSLEFKGAQYRWAEQRDQARAEFAKDVSAMANTAGGHLIIGMRSEEGAASELVGMADLDSDAEILRMEGILQAGVQPRIYGVRMRGLRLADGRQALVLRIPRSFNAPHQVIVNGVNKFYLRNSAGCYEASVEDLRMLFTATSDFQERFHAFVESRLEAVREGSVNVNMARGQSFIAMHIVPLSAFSTSAALDPDALEQLHDIFRPLAARDWGSRVNFDGRIFFREGPDCAGYTQVYRNGIVEAVKARIVMPADGHGGARVHGNDVIEDIVYALRRYMVGLRQLDVNPPLLVQVTLVGVGGATLLLPDLPPGRLVRDQRAPQPMHPPTLRLPWFEVTDYLDNPGYDRLLRRPMDAFVNAAGVDRCKYFDAQDRFIMPPSDR